MSEFVETLENGYTLELLDEDILRDDRRSAEFYCVGDGFNRVATLRDRDGEDFAGIYSVGEFRINRPDGTVIRDVYDLFANKVFTDNDLATMIDPDEWINNPWFEVVMPDDNGVGEVFHDIKEVIDYAVSLTKGDN